MRYVLRDRDPDGPQAREFIRHGLSVLQLPQDAKHGNDVSRGEMAALVMSVESLFAFLLAQR